MWGKEHFAVTEGSALQCKNALLLEQVITSL